tara:strand:+ start:362 stop:532 length:171 start_codon:yes stop_codon:yes gene_type:complete
LHRLEDEHANRRGEVFELINPPHQCIDTGQIGYEINLNALANCKDFLDFIVKRRRT